MNSKTFFPTILLSILILSLEYKILSELSRRIYKELMNKTFKNPILARANGRCLMAIDYGEKFCGISIYRVGIDPYPLASGRIARRDNANFNKEFKQWIDEELVDWIIIGLPKLTDGGLTKMSEIALNFAKECKKNFQLPTYVQDETLTTFEAKDRMRNSAQYNFTVDITKVDALSASIIMEEFLNNTNPEQVN